MLNAFKFEIHTIYLHRFLFYLLSPLLRLSVVNVIAYMCRIKEFLRAAYLLVPMHLRVRVFRFDQLLQESENLKVALIARIVDASEICASFHYLTTFMT